MRKKQVTKKQAETGRPVKCRDCYVNMGIQLTFDGQMEYICPSCGRIWPIGKLNTMAGKPPPTKKRKNEKNKTQGNQGNSNYSDDDIAWLFKL